jgi:hypothetical protein
MNMNYVATSCPIFELIELKVMYHSACIFIFYLGEYDIEASKEASKRPNVQETFLRIYLKITIMNEKRSVMDASV